MMLAGQGVKELILIAQDSTYYGLDLYGSRNLATLLQRLAKVNSIQWIRLMYAYPAKFPKDILDVMAGEEGLLVRRALTAISEDQRTALTLAYFEGLTQSEIAARLAKPLGTVKTHTRLGLMKLRELLGEVGTKR